MNCLRRIPSPYTGELPTTKLIKTNAEAIADTVKWAVWIAGDNRFHYGGPRDSNYNGHKNGCYFCGTNLKIKHFKIKKG